MIIRIGSFLFFGVVMCFSQKTIEKTIIATDYDFVQILADKCYHVTLSTHPSDELQIVALVGEENEEDVSVDIGRDSNTISISPDFHPYFIDSNDKYSELRAVSISLKVKIPEFKQVDLEGTFGSVAATGVYKKLRINLTEGKCFLNELSENVQVKTQTGDIFLQVSSGTINAKSQYGTVFTSDILPDNSIFEINSDQGNIYINKIE